MPSQYVLIGILPTVKWGMVQRYGGQRFAFAHPTWLISSGAGPPHLDSAVLSNGNEDNRKPARVGKSKALPLIHF
ncbi:MAG: hypothetical protein SVR94_19550, partial [Pseudomonadota bacterium]|nr:hypothetical protein [Pseudomonadota bacterium]